MLLAARGRRLPPARLLKGDACGCSHGAAAGRARSTKKIVCSILAGAPRGAARQAQATVFGGSQMTKVARRRDARRRVSNDEELSVFSFGDNGQVKQWTETRKKKQQAPVEAPVERTKSFFEEAPIMKPIINEKEVKLESNLTQLMTDVEKLSADKIAHLEKELAYKTAESDALKRSLEAQDDKVAKLSDALANKTIIMLDSAQKKFDAVKTELDYTRSLLKGSRDLDALDAFKSKYELLQASAGLQYSGGHYANADSGAAVRELEELKVKYAQLQASPGNNHNTGAEELNEIKSKLAALEKKYQIVKSELEYTRSRLG